MNPFVTFVLTWERPAWWSSLCSIMTSTSSQKFTINPLLPYKIKTRERLKRNAIYYDRRQVVFCHNK